MSEPGTLPRRLGAVAIIGMAGRFPGARTVAEFWRNQLEGVEAIQTFSAPELNGGVEAEPSAHGLVAARSVLDDVDLFDADFFNIYPREAALIDPQHRIFLECCWQALEDAGYEPGSGTGEVGIFAGCSIPSYFLLQLCSETHFIEKFTRGYQVENYAEMLGNSLDFLATRVSYKLNLRGPSFTLQTACSTSLVAVCQACQSLLTHQCDMALAGGISITFPQKRGARYQEGGMISPDGHCRAFDAAANGTVFGSGAAVVVLKKLEDALHDGDQIYAVIRGFAVNNDGSSKAGYTAPSVEGQARVILAAQEAAGVHPEEIGYIEAHGTATPLGDPIELAALNKVFGARSQKRRFCAIGTAKTNVGHLDVAAGVTGLIHAAHVVRHGEFPPTLHFQRPNPNCALEDSPFFVNRQRSEWPRSSAPRIAGVSSFGVGGTNAHVIVEEPPATPFDSSARRASLLVLSARSEAALNQATSDLAAHLSAHGTERIEDVAFTLQVGRKAFPWRRALAVASIADAVEALSSPDSKRCKSGLAPRHGRSVVFLFPGQGSQQPAMGRAIYETETVFRNAVDRCAEILHPRLGADLRDALYGTSGPDNLNDTAIAQPAIFAIEYALAQLWQSWGIRPAAMLGHSVGEYVAATLAGVLSLDDASALVAARGKLMQQLPRGAMLSVRLSETNLAERLNGALSLAAVNSPSSCVVSGPLEAIATMEEQLSRDAIAFRRLSTSHAFHSSMMDPVLAPFTEFARKVSVHPPGIPYVSGLTGAWITVEDLQDSSYWAKHLRRGVQFSAGFELLRKDPHHLFLEVGPGTALTAMAREHRAPEAAALIPSLPASGPDAYQGLLSALGSLWVAGVQPDWSEIRKRELRRRVSLPTYPFERKRYWLEREQPAEFDPLPASQTQSSKQELTKVNGLSQSPSVVLASARVDRVRTVLIEIFEELAGAKLSTSDQATTFLELGFDSLFLTQVTIAIQNKFGVKITFRQLLNDFGTLQALAQHLETLVDPSQLRNSAPRATSSEPEPAPGAAPSSSAVVSCQAGTETAAGSSLQQLMQDQLRAMNELFAKQLETLRASTASEGTGKTGDSKQSPAPSPSPDSRSKTADAKDRPFVPFKPPEVSTSGEIHVTERRYLRELIERYTSRTAGSKSMTQRWRSVLADPRVVSGFHPEWKEMVYPIVTVRSLGSRLWDVDGNEYIDILNGFGPILFGHRPDFVERAMERQLREGFEIGPQTSLAGEVAELFCEITGNERMTFCNTGSEAVLAALRVSRTVTGRKKVALFAGSYHGMFDEVLVKPGSKRESVEAYPIAPGIPRESVSNMAVLDYGAPSAIEWIRAHASELAAVLVEPVQSRHPALQPVAFLREIRRITAASGVALVFDEVVTGFRAHPAGCQGLFDIRADLATYGKVLAGGMPIGVLAGKADFMNALDGGLWQFGDDSFPPAGVTFFAGTFVRHPLALAAARATLQHLRSSGSQLQVSLTQKSVELAADLNRLFETHAVPARLEQFASIFYFHFPPDFPLGSLLYYALREKGIYILEGFPFFLTTAHSPGDILKIKDAFADSIGEMASSGIFPQPVKRSTASQLETTGLRDPARLTQAATSFDAPLTEEQLEVWLSAQVSERASCAFNESFTLRMHGGLHREALEGSLSELAARHDALRASVVPETHSLRFEPHVQLPIHFEDLAGLPKREADAKFHAALDEEARTPFHLSAAPLARVRLFKLGETEHTLVFTSHHIICDGWSTNVLLEELARLYSARSSNRTLALPKAPQFYDYALSRAASNADASVRQYWLQQFEKIPPPLELPTDRPRPAVKSFSGSTVRARIDKTLLREIKTAGARENCTLFVSLLTGFGALLHRLTSQDDIVIGIPVAGQSALEDGKLVGHGVNFLPIRTHWLENENVANALQQVKRTLLDAQEHQTYTYGTLVRDLNLRRDPGRLPLIEVQFNLEKVGGKLDFLGLQTEVDPNPKAAVNFDLFLNLVETADGLVLDCDYNSDLFDASTISQWLSHYETLLRGMIANPRGNVGHLPILNELQRRQLLHQWNDTSRAYPRDKCTHQLIQQQVARSPRSVAAVCKGNPLTYEELEHRSNQLAHHLARIGLQPNELIGIAVDRSLDMLIALLAVWKAGAAYVPLDPSYPRERLSFILEDAGIPILITQSDLIEALPASSARLVCLARDAVLIAREESRPLDTLLDPECRAYVIYTSGSTGRPKGVAVTHRNLVNLLWSMQSRPGIRPDDRLLAVTTLAFDISALELFLPLISGACVVMATRDEATDGRALRRLLQDEAVTIMQATPATWRLLLEAGWNEHASLKILCGGEALPRDLADALIARGELWNMYGPTETTVWSAASRVEPGTGPVRFGSPIANTQFYVLDRHQRVLPVGVPGELYIGGDGVAQGYLHRPDLTAQAFLPDPFHPDSDRRVYKTGDEVRYRADGSLEFLGRSDQQVKIRGFRVELQDVEATLGQHPAVQQVVVSVRNDNDDLKNLVAYVVPSPSTSGPSRDGTELRRWLAKRLPSYMVPSLFVFLDELPRTPNGKVDRRALPAPDRNHDHSDAFVAPRTPVEILLAGICADVLRLERVGVNSNLFDLGADSLHLFQIVSRAGKAGVPISPEQLLRLHTVAEVAYEIEHRPAPEPPSLPAMDPVPREDFRLSSLAN